MFQLALPKKSISDWSNNMDGRFSRDSANTKWISSLMLDALVLVEIVVFRWDKKWPPCYAIFHKSRGCHSLILNTRLLIHTSLCHFLLDASYILPYSEFPKHSSFAKAILPTFCPGLLLNKYMCYCVGGKFALYVEQRVYWKWPMSAMLTDGMMKLVPVA